jgi:hypothetical protein
MVQMVETLPSKSQALSSNPSAKKQNKTNKKTTNQPPTLKTKKRISIIS